MNKIEKPTMTVLVNGTAEIREVSHYEEDTVLTVGHRGISGPRRPVPVLEEGEAVLHLLGGGPPHVIRGYWPEVSRAKVFTGVRIKDGWLEGEEL